MTGATLASVIIFGIALIAVAIAPGKFVSFFHTGVFGKPWQRISAAILGTIAIVIGVALSPGSWNGQTSSPETSGSTSIPTITTTLVMGAPSPSLLLSPSPSESPSPSSSPSPSPSPSPDIVLSRAVIRVGDDMTASGGGFNPGEEVFIILDWGRVETLKTLATVKADSAGNFAHVAITVPDPNAINPDLGPGAYNIYAKGSSSGITVWTSFTIAP